METASNGFQCVPCEPVCRHQVYNVVCMTATSYVSCIPAVDSHSMRSRRPFFHSLVHTCCTKAQPAAGPPEQNAGFAGAHAMFRSASRAGRRRNGAHIDTNAGLIPNFITAGLCPRSWSASCKPKVRANLLHCSHLLQAHGFSSMLCLHACRVLSVTDVSVVVEAKDGSKVLTNSGSAPKVLLQAPQIASEHTLQVGTLIDIRDCQNTI